MRLSLIAALLVAVFALPARPRAQTTQHQIVRAAVYRGAKRVALLLSMSATGIKRTLMSALSMSAGGKSGHH
jgi:hypothetical protein